MRTKPILCAHRLRHVPRQFSWIDQRLVRDGHVLGRTAQALALYLFLCTVADAQGLSYYSDRRVGELLGLDGAELGAARRELLKAGLVAYSRPFYQVLSLEPHKMEALDDERPGTLQPERCGQVASVGEILRGVREVRS